MIGTEEIKGFALTLIIGLVWNLFTAVYVSRVLFDFMVEKGLIKELSMMRFMSRTSIDFVSKSRLAAMVSLVVIGIGLLAFVARVSQGTMFNIDFTGGTLVTIRLNPQDPAISGLSLDKRSGYVRGKASRLTGCDSGIAQRGKRSGRHTFQYSYKR